MSAINSRVSFPVGSNEGINPGMRFPVGSIFVREKLSQKHKGQPELLAVMIKREQGFNGVAGDWLFLTVNGSGTKVKSKQKEGRCLSCHQMQWQTDFVYPVAQAKVGAK